MNCANHADVPATAYCRTCGKPLCSNCARDVRGVIYCEECLASHLSGAVPPPGASAVPPGAQPVTGVPSPGLAAILGFIPGVGAMYNGEFAKGFVHVVIFATLIWMAQNVNGLFGLAIAAFVIYMPIEAYKTARAREMGLPPPDPFGFNNLFAPAGSAKPASGVAASAVPAAGGNPGGSNPGGLPETQPLDAEYCPPSRVPIGAFILIGLGVLFLLDEVGVLHFHNFWRFWPLVLIAIGIRILMRRTGRGW
jgi:TM2 domain-containing membrane protein YozV